MTTLENAREFLDTQGGQGNVKDDIKDGYTLLDALLVDHSNHVLSQVIHFLEMNEKKAVKSIIEELKGKV